MPDVTKPAEVTRLHRELAFVAAFENTPPSSIQRDWINGHESPMLSYAMRIAQAIADAEQRGYERGIESRGVSSSRNCESCGEPKACENGCPEQLP